MLQGHLKQQGPGDKWGWKCSCGEPILQCALWGEVNRTLPLEELRTRLDHREGGRSMFESMPKAVDNALHKYALSGMEVAQESLRILLAFAEQSGSSWVVDSSKDALQGYYLHKARPESVRILHLKRSIGEIAFSKLGHRKGGVGSSLQMAQYLNSVALQNRFADEVVARIEPESKFSLHYRDLATEPGASLEALLRFLKVDVRASELPTHMEPFASHSIGGTPSRFERRAIAYDDKSKAYFDKHPLLARYARWLEPKSPR